MPSIPAMRIAMKIAKEIGDKKSPHLLEYCEILAEAIDREFERHSACPEKKNVAIKSLRKAERKKCGGQVLVSANT